MMAVFSLIRSDDDHTAALPPERLDVFDVRRVLSKPYCFGRCQTAAGSRVSASSPLTVAAQ